MNSVLCTGSTAFEPLGLTPDHPAEENDLSFFDDLAAELHGGVCELDDVLLDDLELPLPASAECAASTATFRAAGQAFDLGFVAGTLPALEPEPRDDVISRQVSAGALPHPSNASEPTGFGTPPTHSGASSGPKPSPAGPGPIAAMVPARKDSAVGNGAAVPPAHELTLPFAPSARAAAGGSPLSPAQQRQLLARFIAEQEQRSQERLALLRQQQQQLGEQMAQYRPHAQLPAPKPLRYAQPMASPFKSAADGPAAPAPARENLQQQRDRRQVRLKQLKHSKQRGCSPAVSVLATACKQDAAMLSDDAQQGRGGASVPQNDDSQCSGPSSPDRLCSPKALQSLSSGGSLSMQDLVQANGGGHEQCDGGTEESRREQFRARNRVAQQRYRSRQRERLQEKEVKLVELTEQLTALTTEKETLAARNQLLEQFLSTSKSGDLSSADAETVTKPSEEDPDTWLLDTPTRRLLQTVNDELAGRIGLAPGCTVTVSVRANTFLTSHEVAGMHVSEFDALWREYVAAFGELLRPAECNAQSPAAKRLARLTVEAQMLKGFVAMLYPSRVTNAQNLEIATGSPRAVAADAAGAPSWVLTRIPDVTAGMRKLVAELNFTAGQRRLLVALRKLYLRNLGVLARRRQHLAQDLQDALAMPLGDQQAQVAKAHRRTTAVMAQLRATMRDEHSFLVQLRLAMGSRVLTPVQFARVHLETYPAGVDVVALTNCVAEGVGEPLATEMVQAAASSGVQALALIYGNEAAAEAL